MLRFIFINFDGALGTKSTITVRVDGVPLTKDKALCRSFGNSVENAIPLNINLKKGVKIDYEGTNNEGSAKDIVVELVMEKVG